MKNHRYLHYLGIIMLALFLLYCAEEPTKSLWELDPSYVQRPDPVITAVEPANGAYAGISEVTILGENFDPSDNYAHTRVYFSGNKAQILSMTSTDIHCVAPVVVGDSLNIKVQVDGALMFAEFKPYKLEQAQVEYGGITGAFNPYGMAVDLQENLYVSLGEKRILKVTPEEEQIDYATSAEGVDGFYKAMKMGPGNVLYAARTIFIYEFEQGTPATRSRMSKAINDFDFDENLNIFYATKFAVYFVRQDMTDTLMADYPDVILNSLRVFDGYVYVAGTYSGNDPNHVKRGVWRNKINNNAGELGPNELVLDWQSYFNGTTVGIPDILSITFAEDGDMYLGADSTSISDAITVVKREANGSYSTDNAEPLYPAVLVPPATNLVWGTGQYLYVNRKTTSVDQQRVIRVTMGKNSAPYYGRK